MQQVVVQQVPKEIKVEGGLRIQAGQYTSHVTCNMCIYRSAMALCFQEALLVSGGPPTYIRAQ